MRNKGFVPLIILIFMGVLVAGGTLAYQNKDNLLQAVNELVMKQALSSPVAVLTHTANPTPTSVPATTPTPNIVYVPTVKPIPTVPPLRPITVNGFVYEDRNNDGIFNSDDPGLPNMQLFLYDSYSPSIQISTVYSDSNGNFSITLNVRSGIIVHPTAYNNFVPKTGDKKFSNTSSGAQFGFRSASAPVANQNIGIIEGNVFQDANRNMSRDGGENTTYFYKLYLQDGQGNYFNTVENAQTTDAGGHFKFINLPVPANYTIRLSNPTGAYEILRPETAISLTQTNSQNTNVEIPVYKY